MEWLGPILTGGAAVAAIKLVESVTLWRLNRKAKISDDMKIEEDEAAQTIKYLKTAMRAILHDRIKYLGRAFIVDGGIAFDDRDDLFEMHRIYHDLLDGNGHLDHLMNEVKKLPLK